MKKVFLQVNTKSWITVMAFDLEDEDQVIQQAFELFQWDISKTVSLRVVIPGDLVPLMTWIREDGEWSEVK